MTTAVRRHRALTTKAVRGARRERHQLGWIHWLGILALSAAFVAAFLSIPWEELRGRFVDLYTYRVGFSRGLYTLPTSSEVLTLWQREALWNWSIPKIAAAIGSVDRALWIGTALSVTATTLYVSLSTRSAAYLPILISPLYVDLVYSQVRSAVAVGLLYLSILLFKKVATRPVAALAIVASLFIHNFAAALVILGFTHGSLRHAGSRLDKRVRAAVLISIVVVLAILLTAQRQSVLGALMDRRLFSRVEATGALLTLVLFSMTVPFWLRARMAIEDRNVYFAIAASGLLLALYLAGMSEGVRIMAFALPAIAVGLANWPPRRRALAYAGVMLANALYFSVWLGGMR